MKTLFSAIGGLVIAAVMLAGDKPCSIEAKGSMSGDNLQQLARISMAEAQDIAARSVNVAADKVSVAKSQLEVEDGCLVYTFEVQVEGEKDTRELHVDAGDGKILPLDD